MNKWRQPYTQANLVRSWMATVTPIFAAVTALNAHAAAIDTGNDDLAIRMDTQVRFTAGVRAEKPKDRYLNDASVDETESRFDRGDFFSKRVDVLEDIDITYQRRHGLRFSGSAWWDGAYNGTSHSNIANGNNYQNDRINSYTSRYVKGPRAELLDAFVFTGFDIGTVGVAIKAGRHTLYWGESLFSVGDSIAYSQGPIDQLKAASNPGSEAKELFLPLNQLSLQLQVNEELTFAAQYMLDWKPFRLAPGGTYFATSDGARSDYANTPAGPSPTFGYIPTGTDLKPDKRGDFGVNMRWTPKFADGVIGLYFRRFDDRAPWQVISTSLRNNYSALGFTLPVGGMIPDPDAERNFHFAYGHDTKLTGLSYSTNVAGASIGAEVSYRRDAALRATPYAAQAATGASEYANAQGPRGDTFHALINALYTLPSSSWWDQGLVAAELAYTRLQKVTYNPEDAIARGLTLLQWVDQAGGGTPGLIAVGTKLLSGQFPTRKTVFEGDGNAACDVPDRPKQCATKDAWSLNLSFTPQWNQVFPSWDLGLPLTLGYGIKGTGATIVSTVEGRTTWSAGLNATYKQDYQFQLRYSDFYEQSNELTPNVQNTHGNVILTFKTSF